LVFLDETGTTAKMTRPRGRCLKGERLQSKAPFGHWKTQTKGEHAWPPLCLFKALLLAVWYGLSDVKLAEALDDRASFRRFCGFSADEATPERTAFVRFRRHLIARGLDKTLFDAVTGQLRAKAITVKTGTIVDAAVIASASHKDGEAAWSKHRRRSAVFGFKAHVGADAETALVEEVAVTPKTSTMVGPALRRSRTIAAMSMLIARIAARSSDPLWWRAVDGLRSYSQARLGASRRRHAATTEGMELEREPRSMPDRKDLRDLETEVRPSAHALARDNEGSPASEAHGNSLQSQTHDDHSAKRDSLTYRRAAIASRLPPSSNLQSDRTRGRRKSRRPAPKCQLRAQVS
jgi:Transposase domain (DUF772)